MSILLLLVFSRYLQADPSTFGPGKAAAPGEKQVPFTQKKSSKLQKSPQNFSENSPSVGVKIITVISEDVSKSDIPVVKFAGSCGISTKIRALTPNVSVELTEMKICKSVYYYFNVDGWISGKNLKEAP